MSAPQQKARSPRPAIGGQAVSAHRLHPCACVSDDPISCSRIRYQRFEDDDETGPCECICHESEDANDEGIIKQAAIEPSEEDRLAALPPLMRSSGSIVFNHRHIDYWRARSLTAEERLKDRLPEQRCDECDNGIQDKWNWCAWCGRNLTFPTPPSEDKP
jgi:hypothetical protein